MKAWIGKVLFFIGILHTTAGVSIYKAVLGTILSEKLFNTITTIEGYDRQAAFWFLYAGFMLMVLGVLINWFENNKQNVPRFVEWSLAIITITGIIMMPGSGFWFLILPAAGLFYRRIRM